jgi:hypothetical protein
MLQRLLPSKLVIITWKMFTMFLHTIVRVCTFATQGQHSSYEHFVIPCWLDVNHHATCERMWIHMGIKSSPQVGSPKILEIETLNTLEAHNFLVKPSIKMSPKKKLYSSSRAFQWYVTHHLHASKSRRFLTFSGRESNRQFESRPFFWP